jgi:hypothetical protein
VFERFTEPARQGAALDAGDYELARKLLEIEAREQVMSETDEPPSDEPDPAAA